MSKKRAVAIHYIYSESSGRTICGRRFRADWTGRPAQVKETTRKPDEATCRQCRAAIHDNEVKV